jgi:plastocyanin
VTKLNLKQNFIDLAATLVVLALICLPAIAEIPETSGSETRNVTIYLVAKNIAFNTSSIAVPAGANISMNFDNQDANVPHNFALYETSDAVKSLFVGEIITGLKIITYNFKAPEKPGTYFFRCDIHPGIMTGQFIVQ